MAKIIITGVKGQLGQCLLDAASHHPNHSVAGYDIDRLDILNSDAVYETAKAAGAKALINCVAYNAVDKAEREQSEAWALNAYAVKGLAEVCERLGMWLLHISTDFVFDGNATLPYKEDDTPNPLSVYGASKLGGEQFALSYKRAIVVRTSWLYAPNGTNFLSSLLHLGARQEELRVIDDQIGSPTFTPHLAEALLQIIGEIEASPTPDSLMGLYHFANGGACSRFAFAQEMKERAKFGARLVPISSSAHPTEAIRPAYSVLNCDKIGRLFGIKPPSLEDGLHDYFKMKTL